MLRELFKVKKKPNGYGVCKTTYRKFELEWAKICESMGRKPGIVRLAYWDQLLGFKDSTFWSDCLTTT
jgi:hypothetical protein